MRFRVLTAAVVAAWSKTATATTASVLPDVMDQPAGASVNSSTAAASSCSDVDSPFGPFYSPAGIREVDVFYKNSGSGCSPGTLSLQGSVDQTHWKTLASQHETTAQFEFLGAPCAFPDGWYQGVYVTDDHTFKSTSPPTEISCP